MLEPYAYTLIRIAIGAIFVPHGVHKLFFGGAASAMGYGLGVVELLGGLAIALGLFVRPAAALLIVDVAMIITANIGKGWLWTRGAGRYALQRSVQDYLVPMGYALARVWFALLILPSGYEKVFADGAARIAAGNALRTGLYRVVDGAAGALRHDPARARPRRASSSRS